MRRERGEREERRERGEKEGERGSKGGEGERGSEGEREKAKRNNTTRTSRGRSDGYGLLRLAKKALLLNTFSTSLAASEGERAVVVADLMTPLHSEAERSAR